MSSNDTDSDESIYPPGMPVFPEAGTESYRGHSHWDDLLDREFANDPATVAGVAVDDRTEPDERVQLGTYCPAYLRQWAELIEFAYGHYTNDGFARGEVTLELHKKDEVWRLVGLPDFGHESGVYPAVYNRQYMENRTALPTEADR
ncbi:hypothetical protein [Haloglomus halophilum]|uniref:hypothetical protein n=1 Tax=Haloglomus halophilum TaxID=2962672 RepID=UPI0020C9D927|nr:hypothetical protein [Haloglomus halophilum]